MNTATHILTASAVLARRNQPYRNTAILVGAFLPDLSIFALFAWAKMNGFSQAIIWHELYWQEPWQTFGAISNSFPIWLLVLAIGLLSRSKVMLVVAAAAIIHLALDFPVHADDAHKHFWPLTDWRFHSPLSYWDTNHHSQFVMAAEFVLCLAALIALWLRFSGWLVRTGLVAAMLSLIAVPVFFWATLG